MSDDFVRDFTPIRNADKLQELSEIRMNDRVADADLSLIKGLNSKRVEYLKEMGIGAASELLLRGRTAQMRKSIALGIIKRENIRPTDAAVERYCRSVLSWVRQAELWRVKGMDPDTAYALAVLGVRHVEDLARADADKVFPLIDSMGRMMPEFTGIDREALAELIAEAGAMGGKSSVHQTILRRKLADSLSLTGKRLPIGMDRRQAQRLLALLGDQLAELCAGDLFEGVGMIESDDPVPSHLLRSGGIGDEAAEEVPTVVSIHKIRSGLEAMKTIPRQLNPPRYIRGRVFLVRPGEVLPEEEPERMSYALADARVELEGTVTPNADSTENAEKPHAYTDGRGEFVIELPTGSNLCQTMALTVSQGARKQKFNISAETVMNCPERRLLMEIDTLERINEELLAAEQKLSRLKQIEARMGSEEDPPTPEELVFHETFSPETEALQETIRRADAQMRELAQRVGRSDLSTNDLARILEDLTGREDITADLRSRPFIVNESVFKQIPLDMPKVMPSVKLMEHEDAPVYLPTDTAPSQIFQYSMLQRLVEPDIRKNGKELTRIAVNDALDVSAFRSDLAENHDNLPYMSSLGMGYSLNMHQAWVPDGFALGTLLYSLVLAPGEEQRLIVRENKQRYALSDSAAGTDGVREGYELSQVDNAEAAFDYAMEQMVNASASFRSSSSSWSLGGTRAVGGFMTDGGGSIGFGGGLAGGIGSSSSKGEASSSQTNTHSEASNAAQTFQHGIKMASEKISKANRLSISMATSDQQDSVATRIIANHNHSHTMTIQYWEVMRRYRLATCVDSVELVLFVPVKPIAFYADPTSRRPALPVPGPEMDGDISTSTRPAVTVPRPEADAVDSGDTGTSTRPAPTVPRSEGVSSEDDGRACEEFRKKYEKIVTHYDVLARAVPQQYRAGLEVIRKYSLMDGWRQEPVGSDAEQLVVSFSGRLLNCDRLSAELLLKNGKGIVGGYIVNRTEALDNKCETTEAVCDAIRGIRGWNGIRPDQLQNTTANKMIFDLPAGVTMADIGSVRVGYECQPVRYQLWRSPYTMADNGENPWDVYGDLWHKMWDRAKDDDDSENDERRIAFFKRILPEAWVEQNITISPEKIRTLGPVSIRIVEVRLGGTVIRHSLDSSDIRDGAAVTLYAPTDILTRADQQEAEQAYRHVLANTMRYSQAVWASLSIDERAMLLDQYTIHMDWEEAEQNDTDIPLLNCINVHKLLGFYGNCMLFPFTYPEALARQIGRTAAQLQETLYRYHTNNFRVPVTTISLPTDGMIGEAVLGATNVSEEIDLTRFWNWKDSPIDNMAIDNNYLNSTDYLKDKKTKDLTALNLTGVSQPESVDVIDALAKLMQNERPEFENLTGMDQLKELVNASISSAGTGRDKAMSVAQESMKGVLDFTHNMKKAENERIKTLLENGYTPDGKYNKDAAAKPEDTTDKPGEDKNKGDGGKGKPSGTGGGGMSGAGGSGTGTNTGSITITIHNGTPSASEVKTESVDPDKDKVPPSDTDEEKPRTPTEEADPVDENCRIVCDPVGDPTT